MNKRPIRIECSLDRSELERLNNKVRKSGVSREEYLRQLIKGMVPQDAPPPDYYSMMKEIYEIRKALEYIAAAAEENGLDTSRYEAECMKLDESIKTIVDAVMLPRRA